MRLLLFEELVVDVESEDGSDRSGNHTHAKHRDDTQHTAHLLSSWIDAVVERCSIGAIISERIQRFNRRIDNRLTFRFQVND